MATDLDELGLLLSHNGYAERPEQRKLFELLTSIEPEDAGVPDWINTSSGPTGVVVQAGTGVGKSIAVLAAAARSVERTAVQALIVTPTRVLMDQYMAQDAPAAGKVFDLDVAELRGRRWYVCDKSMDLTSDQDPGCMGRDVGCSLAEWRRGRDLDPDCDGDPVDKYECGYQEAKHNASLADIVITNTDMWIVNDRVLTPLDVPVFDPAGAVFVDEGHQLEQKLRDYASKSIQLRELEKYAGEPGKQLAAALGRIEGKDPVKIKGGSGRPLELIRAARDRGPWTNEKGQITERAEEVHAALNAFTRYLQDPTGQNVVWTDGRALKLDWIDVSLAARDLLEARPFGIVSATIPTTMPESLGIKGVSVHDVGHPFDYADQAELIVSRHSGSWSASREGSNFDERVAELREHVVRARGGALLLFSSFKDMNAVFDRTYGAFRKAGLKVLVQGADPDKTNADLAAEFKANGNAVLFGSESFATGFDVPGQALRFVGIWKLPYPGVDPVTNALRELSYRRYNDVMAMRVTQAAGRLIRTTSDTGVLWVGDSRFEELLKKPDLMTKHLTEFRRV